MLADAQISGILWVKEIPDFFVVNLYEECKRKIAAFVDRRTSMYDTSTTKFMLGSTRFLSSTRTKSSEQVKGIIPLSGPSVIC